MMKKQYAIGRNSESTFSYPAETTVSGTHAYLTLVSKNELLIADNHSTNGVYVNGQRVSTYMLHRNDNLRLGGLWLNVEELFRELWILEYSTENQGAVKNSGLRAPDVSEAFLKLKPLFDEYREHKSQIQKLKEGDIVDKLIRLVPGGNLLKTNQLDFYLLNQELDDWFQERYICPNCQTWLGNVKWETLHLKKNCRTCKAIWAK